ETLPAATHPGVRVFNEDRAEIVAALKAKSGRDIWLFGGGVLFRSLLEAGLVDTVEVAVMPVLLGAGVPLLPPGATTKLVLRNQKILPASGIVVLSYSVPGGVGPAPRIRYIKPAKKRGRTVKKRSSKKRAVTKKETRTQRTHRPRRARRLPHPTFYLGRRGPQPLW